jgi:threonyl-tRNA synthetase
MLGSLERFLGILLEHHDGRLPQWLAPEQVRVLPVHAEQRGYAEEIATRLRERGLRASVDASNETLARRVAEAHALQVSLLWVVGAREANEGTVTERAFGSAQRVLPVVSALEAAARVCAVPLAGRAAGDGTNAFSD